jgi:SGNH domain (fused to AT3 domains)
MIVIFSSAGTKVGQLLGIRLFVGVGLISYSAYLWHQPLFAFARIRFLEEPDKSLMFSLGALSLFLAYFTWRFVERPFRNKIRFSRKRIFQQSAAGTIILLFLGLSGFMSNGFATLRFSNDELQLLAYQNYDKSTAYREGSCFLSERQSHTDFEPYCIALDQAGESILLWGDSYAAALSSGLRELSNNVSQFNASGCPPLVNTEIPNRPHCKAINQYVIQKIAQTSPDIVLLHANWHLYKENNLHIAIQETISAIRRVAPKTVVFLIGSPPEWPTGLPDILLYEKATIANTSSVPTKLLPDLRRLDGELELLADANSVAFISLLDFLCTENSCKAVYREGNDNMLMVWDYGHFTKGGALYVANWLMPYVLNDRKNQ